ncbi:MAG TPA: dihydroneopterin aldolase [Gallionella sp.]|nr:dihydroneopterin aldolase [Gallionella sp.]
MDRIRISDLLVRCILGVNEDERREKQDVVINLVLHADVHQAGKSDNMKYTVDYRALKKRVLAMAERSQYFLVEALAESIAELCLEHQAVRQVDVCVEKPNALRFARSVAVEITRKR